MSGPYAPAPRIPVVLPSPSLLTSASVLPDSVDWRSGLEWVPGCQTSFNEQYCPSPTERTDPEDRERVHVNPFKVYTPLSCVNPFDPADLVALAADLENAHTAAGIAAALWMGDGLPDDDLDNPTLRRTAVDVSAVNAYDLDDGIAALLTHYELCTGGNGGAMIHIPSTLAPYALGGGGGGARVGRPEGNIYRGPLGSVVVPGPGYPLGQSFQGPAGHGPLIPGSNPESYQGNSAYESWVYVTGPVEYDTTPVEMLPAAEADRMQFRTNLYEVWGQRSAIVRFDPCCVFAAVVTNPAPLTEVS